VFPDERAPARRYDPAMAAGEPVTQRASPGRFVVPVSPPRRGVEPRGVQLDPVDDDRCVATVPEAGDWQDVAAATGAAWVAPVLVDDRAHESYPTGEILARFRRPPDDAVLAELERDAGLRLVRRNRYVDTQVVLAPTDEGVYLPDLSARLEERDDVSTAWLGTTSHYRRAGDDAGGSGT
jgi:hypothetical protein